MADLMFCPRHEVMFGAVGYRRHMDDAHDGRSDCIVGMTAAQALRVVRGERLSDVCFRTQEGA